jgi:cytochrome P450
VTPDAVQLLKKADFLSASWLFTYLGCHPNWRDEARAEIKKLIASYSLETVSERNSSSTALSSIPLSAWENETPVLDMLVREAIRLSQAFVSFRLNVGPEMYIDGKVIPRGALVAYPGADVHLDPALYPDPWKFDPARPQPKDSLTFLGWGGGACLGLHLLPKGIIATDVDDASLFFFLFLCLVHGLGRTVCMGSRLARLNIKLVTALSLMDFDFDTVDVGDRIVDSDSAPKPDWNDPFSSQPARGQFFLKYRKLYNPESIPA